MRKTSIEAFKQIMASGLLGKRQKQAYKVLYENGSLTGSELSKMMGMNGQWKRCSELQKKGLVEIVGDKIDPVTKKRVYLWDVTDRKTPIRSDEKTFSYKDKLKIAESALFLITASSSCSCGDCKECIAKRALEKINFKG